MNTNYSIRKMTYIAMMVALLSVMAQISIPLGFGVPLTLQVFGVLLICSLFRTRIATTIILLYLLLGVVGLPVFANFHSGPGSIFGRSGGYLIGYLIAAMALPALRTRFFSFHKGKISEFSLLLLGIVIIHVFGIAQFSVLTGMTLAKSFVILSIFIPVDIVKAIFVILIAPTLKRSIPALESL